MEQIQRYIPPSTHGPGPDSYRPVTLKARTAGYKAFQAENMEQRRILEITNQRDDPSYEFYRSVTHGVS